MSKPMPPDADPTLDPVERELAALYRDLHRAQPDAALDARILAEASRPFVRRPHRYRGLLLGLASVATLAMAAGLAWHTFSPGPGVENQPAAIAAPQAPHAASANGMRQVIQVHVLSGQQDGNTSGIARPAKAEAPGQHATGTTQTRASAAPAAKSLVVPVRIIPQAEQTSASGDSTPGAATLIDQARQALANGNQARARQLVHELLRSHPRQPLPADLSRLRPAANDPGPP